MQHELVSIIMPSYNSIHISESIESVLLQSYQNWELLITDDYSNDSTCEVVESYAAKDSRIKLFRLNTNYGAGIARNNSIYHASGRFLAFLDSDDVWLAEKLEQQIEFMLRYDYEFTFTSYYTCDSEMQVINFVKCLSRVNLLSLATDCSVGCLTAIYDTAKMGKVYMPILRKRQDWGLWLTIVQKCKYGYGLKEALAKYRVSPQSISAKKISLVKYNIAIYNSVLRYSITKSYLMFFLLFLPLYALKKIRLRL